MIHVQNKEVSYGKKITWLLPNNEVFKQSRALENVWVQVHWEEGQTSVHYTPVPSFTGMRSHPQADRWAQWSQNLNPFILQRTQSLIKAHTNFPCGTQWHICNKYLGSFGFGRRRKDVQPGTLNIWICLPFLCPLTLHMSFVFWQCELYLRSCQALPVFLQREKHVDTDGVCGWFSRGWEGDCFFSFP